ncbi:MAG TPA: tetratricopeptide repeat protein [Rhodanobacteraceae bacterium]|nr:tetratricopeptide repeat protein [Rhodanobacteraceae bacterium]
MGNRGFWQELKRRHVYRVAAAYVVVGWLLVQVVTQVFPIFHLPDWIDQAIVLLILVGFPIALVLAWAFDATPQGIVATGRATDSGDASVPLRHRSRRAGVVVGLIGVLIALIAGGAYWHFGRGNMHAQGREPAASAPTVTSATPGMRTAVPSAAPSIATQPIPVQTVSAKSIAVLPFENLSTDKGNAYFADGMQDLILTKLADIGDLKVISRTSTMQYDSHPENLKQIGQQLGVAAILEGSVQKAGNQVLINVQLIDAKTDSHVWAQSYTRTLDNIFGVEGEVADKIAKELNAKLTPAESAAVASVPTHNKQAYDAFLRGTYYLDDEQQRTQDPRELQRSVALLQQAVKLDPDFANAWSALSLAYFHLGGHDDQSASAARRALTLAPNDAFARRMTAYALAGAGKFDQAIAQAKAAVNLMPKSSSTVDGLGNVYLAAGRFEDAIAAYKQAIALDPKQTVPRMNLANVLAIQRRYADARDVLHFVAVRDPSAVGAATELASVYEFGWGDLASARKVLQAVPPSVASSGAMSEAWYWLDLYARDYAAALGSIQKAPASWFTSTHYPLGLYRGQVYQARGDTARAKAAFAEARTQIDDWIKASPGKASLHATLALVLAGLGERGKALQEARHAVALRPIDEDPNGGPDQVANLAMVESRLGETAVAIKRLHQLLSIPAGWSASVSLLKLDPAWDPIRHDPRFQALLKKYGDAASTSTSSAAPPPAATAVAGNE